jgi:ATP-binding cassette subfamily B protein
VALVGENGAGKSTLIKLLLRFYRPTSGQILINGIDLQDMAIESWYKQLATLIQDFNQYPLTIAENIEIGRSSQKANIKLLKRAAKFGNVDQQVAGYEHGWETVLDSSFKKGVEPSGGQWQRVALARAFYRGAEMIILDEPTSAIDAKAEYDIFNNIFLHYKDKTALIVSHRFSTVRRANRIIVLDHGKIIEEGSHHQLMKKEGLYHDMFSKQAEGYR